MIRLPTRILETVRQIAIRSSFASKRSAAQLMLIPRASISSRSLVTIVAIMTFLAALATAAALLIQQTSQSWRSNITQEMTIQVKPQAGRKLESDIEKAAAFARAEKNMLGVRIFTNEESAAMLEPWLGAGVNLKDLPVPRLIVLRPGSGFEATPLRTRLKEEVPTAYLDDHNLWASRLQSMANGLVFLSLGVLCLVLIAMALAIGFATRGAMADTRHIIEVLHLVGAQDRFISRQFQNHFVSLGLKGAMIGGGGAMLAMFITSVILGYWQTSVQASQIQSLFGSFQMHWSGYILLLMMSLGIAILVGAISRMIVVSHLNRGR